MTLLSALGVSLTGLQTTTAQMQLVASNISNAQTEGFSKKTAIVQAVQLGADAGGSIIKGYSRVTSDGTYRSLLSATSEGGLYSTQYDYLQNVQSLFGANTSSTLLSDRITEFTSAWNELAASPESVTQQRQVVQCGINLAEEIQSVSSQVEELDRKIVTDINSKVSELNTYLSVVAEYNQQISAASGAGYPTGQLEDSRDQVVLKIAELTNVNVMKRSQESIALYTPEGYVLLDGEPQTFSYDGTNLLSANNPGMSLNNVLTGGSLQAAVGFRSDNSPTDASIDPSTEVIRKLRSQLDTLANSLVNPTTTSVAGTSTFANAYNPTGDRTLDFFTVTSADVTDPTNQRMTLSVNASIIDGTLALDSSTADAVVEAFNCTDRVFSADGLDVSSSSYEKLTNSVIALFQQSTNIVKTKSDPVESQKDFLTHKLADETGVNIDTELVSLTTLQSAYNASAKVISVINDLFEKLEAAL